MSLEQTVNRSPLMTVPNLARSRRSWPAPSRARPAARLRQSWMTYRQLPLPGYSFPHCTHTHGVPVLHSKNANALAILPPCTRLALRASMTCYCVFEYVGIYEMSLFFGSALYNENHRMLYARQIWMRAESGGLCLRKENGVLLLPEKRVAGPKPCHTAGFAVRFYGSFATCFAEPHALHSQ